MIKQTLSYPSFFIIATIMVVSATALAEASEVTGSLSSDSSATSQTSGKDLEGSVATPQTSGNIEGTVTRPNGSGGGSSSSGGSNSVRPPTGTVLGESITDAPRFPNTGYAPTETVMRQSLWSTIVDSLKRLLSIGT